ncbi:sensor histidine kinase [Telluribacter sp.]|jgi:signal transduction histidine kinase|uniref:sensor histidine kinase n=1 Tax=Telluribacter sp. TaxID=1978767 RepID=UPI002E0ED5FA|nr:ATP-binding protein [Telluribacter sp.]
MNLSSLRLLNRSLDERQLTWAIRFLFGISIMLIIALSYSYHTINKELIFYSERVDHTQRVLITLEKVSSKLYETIYHGRTYLLLKDTANKRAILKSIDDLNPLLDQLDTLMESPPQDKRVQVLRTTLDNLYDRTNIYWTDSTVQLGEQEQQAMLREASGHIEQANRLIREITEVENKLMHTRMQSRDNYKQQVFRYNWVIMLVALVFLSSSFILLDRELKRNNLYRIELENKVENLNRSNNELEQFAYVASHDLQEPLRKIQSFSDRLLLKYSIKLENEAQLMLYKVNDSAQRMQLLINDLLSFSRLVKPGANVQRVDLNDVLEEAKYNLSETITTQKVIIKSSGLPVLKAYRVQMVQLFQNLLSNSIKYSRPDIVPYITISCKLVEGSEIPAIKPAHQDVQFYLIEFSDNGIGFNSEYAEKIFVIFQRLHARDEFEGTGIGLSICRRVISNHNGYIFAKGQEGKGANFYVYLPLQPFIS